MSDRFGLPSILINRTQVKTQSLNQSSAFLFLSQRTYLNSLFIYRVLISGLGYRVSAASTVDDILRIAIVVIFFVA